MNSALIYMLVALAVAYALHFPSWATHILAVGSFVIALVFKVRDHPVKAEERAYDPALLVRVQTICERLGWTDIEPVVVRKPVPLLGRRNGRLSVPISMGELLTELELEAVIRMAYANQRVLDWQLFRFWAPWGVLLAVALGASLYDGRPFYLVLAIAYMIWSQLRARRGLGYVNATRAAMPHFVQSGGDSQVLVTAMLKLNTQVLRLGYNQVGVVGNIRGSIRAVALAGGISDDQLRAIATAVDAPAVLYRAK